MEPSGLFNYAVRVKEWLFNRGNDLFNYGVRVKEEPCDESLTENYSETIYKTTDLKNIYLLPLLEENSTHTLPKCHLNHESELDSQMEIVYESEDVKPDINLLVNTIKVEPAEEVKQEIIGDVVEESNLNFEFVQQKKKTIPNMFNNKHRTKKHVGVVHNDRKSYCVICEKFFAQKSSLTTHINMLHNGVTYLCHTCQKTFARKDYLQNHIDKVHNGIMYACDSCPKIFSRKDHLKVHVDAVHNKITHACDVCGKKFSQKHRLKNHIMLLHIGFAYPYAHTCDVCQKTFTKKNYLRNHIDSVHKGVRHACDICRKKFAQKYTLKNHVITVHIL